MAASRTRTWRAIVVGRSCLYGGGGGKETQRGQRVGHLGYEFSLVPPYGGVHDAVLPELDARLLERLDAIRAVVLQVRVRRVDGVRCTPLAEARQREVVVQRERALRVVEALDVLVRLGVVLAAVHVLQHVHVSWYGLEPAVRVDQVVQEVHVAYIVGRARLVTHRQSFG